MSDHEIVWRFERDCVRGEVICHADLTADCHREPTCDCESWPKDSEVRHPDLGITGHWYTTEHDDGSETAVLHPLRPSTSCNLLPWLNDEPGLLPELADGEREFEIGRTPISCSWDGDQVLWSRP